MLQNINGISVSNEIINIQNINFNNQNINCVNARELWQRLESKRQFANWIEERLERFVEKIDYIRFNNFVKGERGYGNKTLKDYYLTIDCAKMICMLENNSIGDKIRQYFIQCEKQTIQQRQLSPEEIILMQAQSLVNLKREIRETKEEQQNQHKDIRKLQNNINRLEVNNKYLTVIAFANTRGIRAKDYKASVIGRKASKICRDRNINTGSIVDPRYGNIKTYPIEILEECFNI